MKYPLLALAVILSGCAHNEPKFTPPIPTQERKTTIDKEYYEPCAKLPPISNKDPSGRLYCQDSNVVCELALVEYIKTISKSYSSCRLKVENHINLLRGLVKND